MNKQKKLKLILSSFKQKQLLRFFESFLDAIKCKFYKSIKQISFSCYQSTCQVENFMVNGYGKTSSEALISGINNIIDFLIQEEQYCQIMRQCLRKFNVSSYGLSSNAGTSKKQLICTQKPVKTMGAESSASVQKRVLTMSANLSSNSKDKCSKAKSIKQQIFEYFNLQNLKVKNPNQSFTSASPLAVSHKLQKHVSATQGVNTCASKQRYPLNPQQMTTNIPSAEKQLEQVYKRMQQVQHKISEAQKLNMKLKHEVHNKKRTQISIDETLSNNNNFMRPSLDNKQKKLTLPASNTQSSKKISYLQMSLNDKFLLASQQPKVQGFDAKNQNHFKNVQINPHTKTNQKDAVGKWNVKNIQNKSIQQRKCLVDISNIKTEVTQPNLPTKHTQYATFNAPNPKLSIQPKPSNNVFQTVNSYTQQGYQCNPILYTKNYQNQESLSIIESSKKLRSFSVQNNLIEKVKSYSTSTKNPVLTGANLNASFDNCNTVGTTIAITQKKVKIPKLNLQILPNYHGKSNKSLNQSLMENYEKKNRTINTLNE